MVNDRCKEEENCESGYVNMGKTQVCGPSLGQAGTTRTGGQPFPDRGHVPLTVDHTPKGGATPPAASPFEAYVRTHWTQVS